MATVQQLKTQIENANALGRTNLANKGVELPETATTYEIMQGIAEVANGSGNVGVNTECEISTADTLICTFWSNRQAIKTNDGLAIVGQLWNGKNLLIYSVGKTKTTAQFHFANFSTPPSNTYFEYDGETYCLFSSGLLYAEGLAIDGVPPIDVSKIIPLNESDSEGKKLLDYYYGKTTLI